MGSSCVKGYTGAPSPTIPEGIVELKKQRQFTEDWKSKFEVTLNCYFTTIGTMHVKAIPSLKKCKGIIVVQLSIRSKDQSYSKLYSILNKPVLQWHGIDIKTQVPLYFPYNMWEGEHTTFAFFQPETSTNRGFCTVTGKIGQEEILIEEELRFGNQVPSSKLAKISEQLKYQLKTLQQPVKKTKISIEHSSQRNSRDTGYTSEHTPYRALRYNEHDTDSEQEDAEQLKQNKERRSKMRRKDTPAVRVRPCIKPPSDKRSPPSAAAPLIEEIETNFGHSDKSSALPVSGGCSPSSHDIKESTRKISKRKKKSITFRLTQDDNVQHIDAATRERTESMSKVSPAEDADDEDEHAIRTDISGPRTYEVSENPVDIHLGKPERPRQHGEKTDELSVSDFRDDTGNVLTPPVIESEPNSPSKDEDNKGATDGKTCTDKHTVEHELNDATTNIGTLIEDKMQKDEGSANIFTSDKQEKKYEAIELQKKKPQPIVLIKDVSEQLINQHSQVDDISSTIHPESEDTVDEFGSPMFLFQTDDAEQEDKTEVFGPVGSPAEECQMRAKSDSFSVMNRKAQLAKKCKSVCSSELSAQLKKLTEPREEEKPPLSPKGFIE